MPENRAKQGRKANSGSFRPGVSGNPGGRPKVLAEVRELAREHTEAAIRGLARVLVEKKAPAMARIAAAEALLNRGWGKPAQAVEVSGPDGEPVKSEISHAQSPEQLAAVIRILAGAAPAAESVTVLGSDASTDAKAD